MKQNQMNTAGDFFLTEIVPEGWRCPVCHCGVNPKLDNCPCVATTVSVTTTTAEESGYVSPVTT